MSRLEDSLLQNIQLRFDMPLKELRQGRTHIYKGFMIRQDGGSFYAQDMCNTDYFLNGRFNRMEKDQCFRYVNLESAAKAIDRYEKINPQDPIFDHPTTNTLEMVEDEPPQNLSLNDCDTNGWPEGHTAV